jgi:hypothetical protein
MPKINFTIPSPLDAPTTYSKIQGFLKSENDFTKFDPSVKCTFEDIKKNCHVKGSQFSADLKVSDGPASKSTIEVQVEIGFALTLFKGKIQEMLEKTVHKVLKT